VEMYKLMDLDVIYTPSDNSSLIMVGQKQLRFAVRITDVSDKPKKRTHIAFISGNPQEVVRKIRIWAESEGFKFRKGGWSDNIESLFDLPDIFISFVAEVLYTSAS